jgi:uroporphyrin-III C-methyltransferase
LSGKVWLVGAGPGDPELLTLKAVRAIREAEVILCDDLVGAAALAHARPGTRVVHVGKRGGCASTPQEFIEGLMVAEARQGRTVVRLKGGDPFIFGRGGEECEALRRAGIAHEVVSGVTAGLAAAASLGVPLTHRALCHGAIFVTGHERAGGDTDWATLAATGLPLVIYMGVARCEAIQRALLEAGMPAAMPAAVVSQASLPDERRIATCLGDLARDLRAAALASPAIMIVGEVARAAGIRLAQAAARSARGNPAAPPRRSPRPRELRSR